ncbi:MAG: FAD-binding protein [Gemmatimonadota bacterium]
MSAIATPTAERLAPELAAELRGILGPDGLIADPGRLVSYESDGLTSHRHPPRAVLLPRSTDQVAAAVRALADAGVPFVARGSGTGLSGGAVPLHGAVVLSTARMTRILEMDPANRRARVEAGVVNVRISKAAEPHGLYYAPDPSSQSACTIGGNVAENSGGPHCLKYGVTTNHITGLTVVLPDGGVMELGGSAGEGAGYDLVGLFVEHLRRRVPDGRRGGAGGGSGRRAGGDGGGRGAGAGDLRSVGGA